MSRSETMVASEILVPAEKRLQRALRAGVAIHEKDPRLFQTKSGEYATAAKHFDFFKTSVGTGEPLFGVIVSEFDTNDEPTKLLYTLTFGNGAIRIEPGLVDSGELAIMEEFGLPIASDAETLKKLREIQAELDGEFPEGIIIPEGGEKWQPTETTKTLVADIVESLSGQTTYRLSHWIGNGAEYQVETEIDEPNTPVNIVFIKKTVSSEGFSPDSVVATMRESSWQYTDNKQVFTTKGPYLASDGSDNGLRDYYNKMNSTSVTNREPENLDIGIGLMLDKKLLKEVAVASNGLSPEAYIPSESIH